MALDPDEQALVDFMKQRELNVKGKQRATDALMYRERRFRVVVLAIVGALTAALAATVIFAILRNYLDRAGWWLLGLVVVVLFVAVGVEIGRAFLRTRAGQRLVVMRRRMLRKRYHDDLNNGRRWLQFYYKGENIAPYIPQMLFYLESDQRFDSIDEALAFAKQNRRTSALTAVAAEKEFNRIAAGTSLVVVSTIDVAGRPASRLMRFVTTDQAGVWYVSTAPESPKVQEFESGKVAIVTVPADGGGTLSSNRLFISRAPFNLDRVAALFEAQIPSYLDGVTLDEQRRELVYELRLQSVRVDTWLSHELVSFPDPAAAAPDAAR